MGNDDELSSYTDREMKIFRKGIALGFSRGVMQARREALEIFSLGQDCLVNQEEELRLKQLEEAKDIVKKWLK